jgi:hypothetical protein
MAKYMGQEKQSKTEEHSNVLQMVGKVDLRSRDTSGEVVKAALRLCLWHGGEWVELGSKSRRVVGQEEHDSS